MMSTIYYWKTVEDGALLILLTGLLGTIQIFLSFTAAFTLFIVSPVVLAFLPLGVVVAQATSAAVLAEVLARQTLASRQPRTSARPLRKYLIRFILLLLAGGIVVGIWGGFYALYFLITPFNQPAFLVKYIVANTAGALITLIIAVFVEWIFKR